jgi:AbrB family looped-hinge helix DNA binding protein
MDSKTTVSARGQVVIPKIVRESMGLHYGSELIIHMRADSILEFKPVKKKLSAFFGMGARKHFKTAPIDVDEAIAEAVSDNNRTNKKNS